MEIFAKGDETMINELKMAITIFLTIVLTLLFFLFFANVYLYLNDWEYSFNQDNEIGLAFGMIYMSSLILSDLLIKKVLLKNKSKVKK